MVSELAKRAAGTYVEDGPPPEVDLLAWFQDSCRIGELAPVVEAFCRSIPERPDPQLVRVEHVDASHVYGSIPCRVADRESNSTFLTEVRFQLALRTRAVAESALTVLATFAFAFTALAFALRPPLA